jgi:hypothetical protein
MLSRRGKKPKKSARPNWLAGTLTSQNRGIDPFAELTSADIRKAFENLNGDCPPVLSLEQAAKVEDVVSIVDIDAALGMPGVTGVPHGSLTLLGIVAVPVDTERVRLVGTSPIAARIANHVHWGLRRRQVTAEELIEATLGLVPNGRKTSVTDARLEEALTFFFERFEIDFSEVVDRTPVLV